MGRFLVPIVFFVLMWAGRIMLKRYLRRRNEPPAPTGKSSARVVEGSYEVKDEEET